jgi:hypothetical protein
LEAGPGGSVRSPHPLRAGFLRCPPPSTALPPPLAAPGRPRPADALSLAGCDYLVLSAKVMADLEATPTLQARTPGPPRPQRRREQAAGSLAQCAAPCPHSSFLFSLALLTRLSPPLPPTLPPPTAQGYNSGLSAAASADDEGVVRALSPDALTDDDEVAPLGAVDEGLFNESLSMAGRELLDAGLAGMVADVKGVLPYFTDLAVSAE